MREVGTERKSDTLNGVLKKAGRKDRRVKERERERRKMNDTSTVDMRVGSPLLFFFSLLFFLLFIMSLRASDERGVLPPLSFTLSSQLI